MPIFEFTSPEGKTYEVNGPEGATSKQAFGLLQQHLGASAEQPASAAPEKPLAEKLQNFGANVTPQGPISGILALARLAGQASKGTVDLQSDEGINRAIPSVVEGSVAAAPSARSPVRVPRAPELPSEPVVNTPSAASPTPVTSMWDKVKAAAPYILAETLTSTHGAPGMGSLAVASAKHFMSKSISDVLKAPEAAAAPEAAPSFSTLTPKQRAAPPAEGPMAPESFVNGEDLAKARQQADVMNLLYRLKQQNTPAEPAPVAAVKAQTQATAVAPPPEAPAEYSPIASGHGEKSPAEMMDYRMSEMRRRGTLFNEAGYSKAVAAKATVQDQMARGLANDVPELGMTKAEILDHIRSETNQAQAEQLANYWANKVPAKAGRIREVFSATNLRAGWSKRGKAR